MSDVNVFIPEDNSVTDITGDKVKIPKLTWKKELRLIKIIQETMDELAKNSVNLTDTSTENVVNSALRMVPDKITTFMSIVMDRESAWVEDNLDSTEIIGVIIPLLKSRFDLIAQKIQPFLSAPVVATQATNSQPSLPENTQTIQ